MLSIEDIICGISGEHFWNSVASGSISKHLENLGPEEFLIRRLHQGGELDLVGARIVDHDLVQVTVHLAKKFDLIERWAVEILPPCGKTFQCLKAGQIECRRTM